MMFGIVIRDEVTASILTMRGIPRVLARVHYGFYHYNFHH